LCYIKAEIYEINETAATEFNKTFSTKEKIEDNASQERFLELVASSRRSEWKNDLRNKSAYS
jgi:hypothetical protein